MARYRYLNCSELVAARWLASEALRWRRPRRASRARMYVTHPGRDLAPLTLAVRQWLGRVAPSPEPLPPALPVPRRAADATPLRSRMPEPRVGVEQRYKPPVAPAAAAGAAPGSAVAPLSPADPASSTPLRVVQEPVLTPGGGFTGALSSRPRIQALRDKTRARTCSQAPARAEAEQAGLRAATRLRARTAALGHGSRMTAERDGLWKDSLAAARILAWDLGRAA